MTLREELEINIRKLLNLYPKDNRIDLEKMLGGFLWKNNPQGKKCLKIIQQVPEYEIFDNYTQCVGYSGKIFTLGHLLDWILNRSRETNPRNSISELDFYISNPQMRIELVQLLKGSMSKKPYRFSNGVLYTDINTIYKNPSCLNNTYLAKKLTNISLEIPSRDYVTGLFTVEFSHPVLHSKENTKFIKKNFIPLEKLKNTRLCLSLVLSIKNSIYSLGSSVFLPDNIPQIFYGGQVWRSAISKESMFSSEITDSDFEKANELLIKFEKFDIDLKNKLRIPLERLNNFGTKEPIVDRAIELRICLESIFLSDGNKEQLRFRLALRAALFLAKDLVERKKVFKIIKTAYDISSTAVHSGKLTNKTKTGILLEAANLAQLALIKLIKKGVINWEDLELTP